MSKTCGDYGGMQANGQPCGRKAAVNGGPCNDHTDKAVKQAAGMRQQFLDLYSSGEHTIRAAATSIGVDVVTIWRWRKKDPAFDESMSAAQAEVDGVRLAMVEDSYFRRLISVQATAAEMIFYLVNRGGGRWQHVQRIRHSGEIATTPLKEMSNEELMRHAEQLAHRISAFIGGEFSDNGDRALVSRVKDDRS